MPRAHAETSAAASRLGNGGAWGGGGGCKDSDPERASKLQFITGVAGSRMGTDQGLALRPDKRRRVAHDPRMPRSTPNMMPSKPQTTAKYGQGYVGRRGGPPAPRPPPQGAWPMANHCPPDGQCQLQRHLLPTVTPPKAMATSSNRLPNRFWSPPSLLMHRCVRLQRCPLW